jgi:hypothetical protein
MASCRWRWSAEERGASYLVVVRRGKGGGEIAHLDFVPAQRHAHVAPVDAPPAVEAARVCIKTWTTSTNKLSVPLMSQVRTRWTLAAHAAALIGAAGEEAEAVADRLAAAAVVLEAHKVMAGVGLPRLAAVDVGVWTRLQRHASAKSEKRRTTKREAPKSEAEARTRPH